MSYLLHAVKLQFARRCAALGDLVLTHDEFLELFVAPEHRRNFMQVAQLVVDNYADRGQVTCSIPDGVVTLQVELSEFEGVRPPFIPAGKLHVPFTADFTGGCAYNICSWAKERYELGVEFGRVNKVLNILNKKLRTPQQVRYYLPAIRTLCSEFPSGLYSFANEIAEVNCSRPPPLPVEVRDACRVVAATITVSSLLETPEEVKKRYPMKLDFVHAPSVASPIGPIEVM